MEIKKHKNDQSSKEKHKIGAYNKSDENTIFIRNLSFMTTETELASHFMQFGDIHYAKLVIDSDSKQSKGMAFVKFVKKEAAQQILQRVHSHSVGESEETSLIFLGGRMMNICAAVDRKEATKFKSDNNRHGNEKSDDSRGDANSKKTPDLVHFGNIRQDGPNSNGMSKGDAQKRVNILRAKKQLLKNADKFVSSTRICIHNIPARITDEQLRAKYQQLIGRDVKILECRIMRNVPAGSKLSKKSIKAQPSLGFGFLTFATNADAERAINLSNNNPEFFSNERRPIVEFSIESLKVLHLQKERAKKEEQCKQKSIENSSFNNKTKSSMKIEDLKKVSEDVPLKKTIKKKKTSTHKKNKRNKFK